MKIFKLTLAALVINVFAAAAIIAQDKTNQVQPQTKNDAITSRSGGGLNGEFDRIQEEIDFPSNEKEKATEQEKSTLLVAMKHALAREYRLKDADKLTVNDITYEQHEQNDLLFFVKYKEFVGRFRYKNAPSKYFSLPMESKVLLKPGAKYEERESIFAKENKKEAQASNNNTQGKPQGQ